MSGLAQKKDLHIFFTTGFSRGSDSIADIGRSFLPPINGLYSYAAATYAEALLQKFTQRSLAGKRPLVVYTAGTITLPT